MLFSVLAPGWAQLLVCQGGPCPQLSEGVDSLRPDTWLASLSGDLRVKGCGLLLPALPRDAAVMITGDILQT